MEVALNGIDVHEYTKPEALGDALSNKLENYNVDADLEEVGIVEKIGDGIATVIGMKNAMAGELVELPHNVSGMVLNFEPGQRWYRTDGRRDQNQRRRRSSPYRPHHGGSCW